LATPRIFISYRREDSSGHAGRLFDRLCDRFGRERVFRDFETIAAGDDFVEALRRRIAQSDVVLVLIGPRWLAATNDEGQWRLADENDWVRIEIEAALERKIRVIPVLVQGAVMPRPKDVPGALAGLAQRNAVELRDASFDQDARALLDQLEPTWRHRLGRVVLRRPVYAAAAVVLAAVAGGWVYSRMALTPERARISLAQMGMKYDEQTLVQSAAKNDLQAVRLLIAAGMPVNTQSGGDGLKEAAGDLHLEMVKLLFAHGARDDRALSRSVAPVGKRDVFDFLVAGQPTSAALGAALRRAAATPYTDLVQQLLDRGADPNAKGSGDGSSAATPLHAAARGWQVDTVLLLLARGADVNATTREGETALHEAIQARSGHETVDEQQLIRILEPMVQKGANVNARWHQLSDWNPTPLLQAIRERRSRVALWLLDHGAEAEVWAGEQYDGQRSALVWASLEGLPDVVQALLAKGAAVDLRNNAGLTALMTAVSGNRVDLGCVRALLAAGANANARDDEGRTALMWAVSAGASADAIRVLLAARTSVNATDKHAWSALMYAAATGHVDATRELLSAHANISLRNADGKDALMIATQAKHTDVATMLTKRGAGREVAVEP